MTIAPPDLPGRFDRWRRGIIRWCSWLAVFGFLFMFAAAALNSGLFVLGILLGLMPMLFLGLHPLGAALGAGLRQPGILPDIMRTGAALGGIGSLLLAWRVVRSGRVESAPLTAGILVLAALIGVASVLRRPAPRRPLLPVSVVIGMGLALFFARLPAMFAGVKPLAWHNEMRAVANDVLHWQRALRADSGDYASVLDTAQLGNFRRGGLTRVRFERTRDGYRAWTSSAGLAERFQCAVYEGSVPAEPARAPGVVACIEYPDYELQNLARAWIAAILATGFISLAVRRSAVSAPAPAPGNPDRPETPGDRG